MTVSILLSLMLSSALPSGVTLIHVERKAPFTAFAIALPLGSELDPPGKAGLASVCALAIEESIRAAAADELPRAFEQLGGMVAVRTGPTASILSGGAPADRFDEAMAIVFRAIAHPAIDERTAIARAVFERSSAGDDGAELARIEARRLLFGAAATLGEVGELSTITRADIEKLLAERTKAESITLAVAGEAAAVARASAWTSVLPRGRAAPIKRAAPSRSRGRKLIVVDRADPAGPLIMIARPWSSPSAEKLPAMLAAAATLEILGARAELDPGLGMASIAVRAPPAIEKNAAAAIAKTTRSALGALDKWRHGPSSDAIAAAKKRAATRAEVALADPATHALALAATHAQGRAVSTREALAANILAAGDAEIASFARILSSGDDLAIVVVAGATQELVRELAQIPGVRDVSIVSSER